MPSFFVTHPEVTVDPTIPIQEWALSAEGRSRTLRGGETLRGQVDVIVSSTERKALDTALILSEALGVDSTSDPALGEMDRSATGYLPPDLLEAAVDEFFARPEESAGGWERAVDAQRRIEAAVRRTLHERNDTRVAFVAHGGVGALLLASVTGVPISRALDQPGSGSYFAFDPMTWEALSPWSRLG